MKHTTESRDLHASLTKSRPGAMLSRFIANTLTLNSNSSRVPVQTRVMETARTLCTILESAAGHASIGLVTESGNLPNFIVVADLFGDKVAAWSEKQALIREMCACNYGSADAAFGMGSAMRVDVDSMVEMVDCLPREDAGKTSPSLVLVLSAPWGLGLGDRFWRLFSVRKGADGRIIDSEFFLTSLNPPPARQGRTVFGDDQMRATQRQIDAFKRETRAMCIDSVPETIHSPTTVMEDKNAVAPPQDDTVSKQKYDVAMSLLRDLRAQLSSTKEQLEASHRDRDVQVAEMSESRVKDVQEMLHRDIAHLYAQIDVHRTHCQEAINLQQQTKVYMHAMEGELTEFDEEIKRFESNVVFMNDRITELNGRLLVSEDAHETQKRTSSSKSRKNTELEKQVRILQSRLDAQIESTNAEKLKAEEALLNLQNRLDESKRTSATTLSSVYDARDAETRRMQETEKSLRTRIEKSDLNLAQHMSKRSLLLSQYVVRQFVEAGSRRKARRSIALAQAEHAFMWLLRLVRKNIQCRKDNAKEQPAALATNDVVTQTEEAKPNTEFVQFPADAVASAKSCISVLERFVNRAQTSGSATNNHAAVARAPPPPPPPQEWQPPQSESRPPAEMQTHGHFYAYPFHNGNFGQPNMFYGNSNNFGFEHITQDHPTFPTATAQYRRTHKRR